MAERSERDALEREYRDHSTWLVSIARRRLASPHEAEDVVHDAFIRASRYPAEQRTQPRSLLARILRNLIKDRARSSSREQACRLTTEETEPLSSADGEQHSLLAVKQVILAMPETYREVFLLSRFTTLSQIEIASRLGISVKTVEWRLSKALAYCAERLGK